MFYLERFQELSRRRPNFRVVYAPSDPLEPRERWGGETGFVHLAVDKYLEAGARRRAFPCGPPPARKARNGSPGPDETDGRCEPQPDGYAQTAISDPTGLRPEAMARGR